MIQIRKVRPSEKARPTLLTSRFVAVALASLAYFTGAGVLIPAVPRYVEGPLGAGNAAVGLVVGAFSVSAFLLRPWAGGLGDRRGRRPLMLAGASLFAVSVLGYALASSPAMLAALRLLTGAGEAFFFVGAVTSFTDLVPAQRRGEAMSLASLSLYAGIGVGALLSEVAIERFGFAGAWILAATAALTAVVMVLRVPETRPEGFDAGGTGAGAVGPTPRHGLVHRGGLLPGLVLLTSVLGMAGFLTFVPLYARDVGMSGSRVVLMMFSGIVIGIRSAGARIPDQLGAARATRVALGLSAVGFAVMGVWQTPVGLLCGAATCAVGIALLTPALMALALEDVPPRERGAVIGTTSAFLDLAFGVGPVMMGFVAAAVGRPGTFVVGSGVAAAGLALVVWTNLGRPSRSAAPVPA
jgi:MFS family permease